MTNPIVYLVGAGPGDPGLLTLRGKECLEQADFVLYDQLVSTRILEHARPGAELVCVRELGATHPERCGHIIERLIDEARKGRCVVRLKGGDPLIFGRGGEEAEALRAAGIPYEIVPGVTAALAAGAYLEVPLTHRDHASAVAFVTGHEDPRKPESRLDWQALAAFPGTLAIYMGVARLGLIARKLIGHGKAPDTPVIVVHKASTGAQRSVTATLATLEEAVTRAGLKAPALALVGEVAALKPLRSWFEKKPLFGVRVLVTRPRQQAAPMVQQLEQLGAVALQMPTVEIREPDNWEPADLAQFLLGQRRFEWLIFTSANGVDAFFRRLRRNGSDCRVLGFAKVAAIGPATAATLRRYFVEADVAPSEGMNSEQLARELIGRVSGQRVLLAQAEGGRDVLVEQLGMVAEIEVVAVYKQSDAAPIPEVLEQLRQGEVDVVTLTSPNIARAFLRVCDDAIRERLMTETIRCVTNGPRISAVLREAGLPVSAEARTPATGAIVQAIVELVDRGRSSREQGEVSGGEDQRTSL